MSVTDLAPARRTRGKSRTKNWRREQDAPIAVIRLELDASDPRALRRVQAMFGAAFRLHRALQAQARSRVDAYWAAEHLREVDAKQARARFGLSRTALETAAYRHVENAGWMRHHLTKALAMHLADAVWQACDRHLFPDRSGHRLGRPRVGRWFAFTRVAGRARSHTKPRTWETFRLVGSLDGHTATYPPRRPESVITQPAGMPAPARPASGWWAYDGPLAVVFTGLPAGDLVLPVRLPQGAGQWPRLQHFLADPTVWHKIDLVRVEDQRAPGGWRYYAHLMILAAGWTSPIVAADRAAAPQDRVGGVDGNVSNLAVVSMPADPHDGGGLAAEHVTVTADQRARAEQAAVTARRRQRALDRSRRCSNAAQYTLGRRQARRAERRQQAGLPERTVEVPIGPRISNTAGRPNRAYQHDELSTAYRRTRAQHAEDSRAASQAKHHRARDLARKTVHIHGPHLVVEHVDIRVWARRWGKSIAMFSPGMLIAALDREAKAAGGRLLRAGTRQTALSQQCPCGHRAKRPLAQRTHHCAVCGLVGDRDLVAAAMAACVRLTDPDDPRTARIDETLAAALRQRAAGQQEALARSTAPAPASAPAGAAVGAAATHMVASAGRTTLATGCATPDETPSPRHGTTRTHTPAERKPAPQAGGQSRKPLRLNS
ncbi:zinc ribbon domain-containing protein [Dactylosporangium darangshiense]|uniref:Cas12f1-like TNB domain-containing protein n=1 Tax=Dactylosporangium darangshiense TaxID=579108 RepID=A0ABP8CTU1_9ACTN